VEKVQQWSETMRLSIGKVILGKDEIIEKVLATMLCGGHLLLEDLPGVGKTILARALSASLGGKFQRIQCTPDLLPSDIQGVSVYVPALKRFRFHPGPLMTHFLLVDEINRATPRSQSALLEAMEAGKLTLEGKTTSLPDPFFLIATENPLEFEGTFPLPEAQKDRFFMTLSMGYPPAEAEMELMNQQKGVTHPVETLQPVSQVKELLELRNLVSQVPVDPNIEDLILKLVRRTREDNRLDIGASPRAATALYKGVQALTAIRGNSSDPLGIIQELAVPILLKRIKVKTESLLNGMEEEQIIQSILERVIQEENQ